MKVDNLKSLLLIPFPIHYLLDPVSKNKEISNFHDR